ncbi:MAG: PP2C family serine/threonine-protein phosphatase [Ardenticatenales bacterium]
MTTAAPWRLAAASVIGSSHAAAGTVCQDAHAARIRPDGVLVAAIADGAGSAPHSARGASVAVAAAVGTLFDASMDNGETRGDRAATALAAALRAAAAAVHALAEAEGLAPRDLACTLSCAMVGPDGALAAQIGDGFVVVGVDEGGHDEGGHDEGGHDEGEDDAASSAATHALVPLSAPERGAYANETVFLTSPNAVETAIETMQRFDGPVAAVALLTDGLLRLAMNMAERTPHVGFFEPLFRFVSRPVAVDGYMAGDADQGGRADRALTAFLESPRVRARTDDDVTLVLAARPAPADPP